MNTLVIAGGPSANVAMFAALDRKPDRIWGCNRAVRLHDKLDCYVATDPNNQHKYDADMIEAVARGTELWLPPWYSGTELPHREFTYDQKKPIDYSREVIAHGRAVGLVTLQLALRENPKSVYLVGFDGYACDARSKHEITSGKMFQAISEYPNGGRMGWWAEVNACMDKVVQQIVADRQDVHFVWFHPQILTPPAGPNMEIVQ